MNHCAIHLVQIVMYVVCVVSQISACYSANVCLASVDCCGYQWILEIDSRYSTCCAYSLLILNACLVALASLNVRTVQCPTFITVASVVHSVCVCVFCSERQWQ